MQKTLGKNCAFKRKAHKEQDCGELCECDCHKKQIPESLRQQLSRAGKKSWQKKLERAEKAKKVENKNRNPK